MPKVDFEVIIIGARDDKWRRRLRKDLLNRTAKLSDCGETIAILGHDDLSNRLQAGRTTAVVLGRGRSIPKEQEDAISLCQKSNVPIFPVVEDLTRFGDLVSDSLAPYNGFELRHERDIGELTGLVLESLGLQRDRRKVFISYARKDSTAIAHQLREAFVGRWYTVFHDTVSIRPGQDFEEELLQQLADSDVMLLLNSKLIEKRPYVQKEIEFANLAAIGGVQVVWPDVDPRRDAGLFTRVDLGERGRMRGNRLSPDGIAEILRAVADVRTTLQVQREEKLVQPIVDYAQRRKWKAVRHLGRFVMLHGPNGSATIRLPFALGVPTSFDFERIWTEAGAPSRAANLVHDPLGLTERQSDHIEFLGKRLRLKFLDYKTPRSWRIIP